MNYTKDEVRQFVEEAETMAPINENFGKLPGSYLFSTVAAHAGEHDLLGVL